MAAGEGTRLRPLTERWPKPIMPIDGRPVVGTLIQELAAAGVEGLAVVTGHLAEKVEALVEPLPMRSGSRGSPSGRLGGRGRAREGDAAVPRRRGGHQVRPGDLARFVEHARETEGAVAIRRQPGRPDYTRIHVEDGRVAGMHAADPPGGWTAAPTCGSARAWRRTSTRPGKPPYELVDVFQLAIDAGVRALLSRSGRPATSRCP